jgi:hypothetical protein
LKAFTGTLVRRAFGLFLRVLDLRRSRTNAERGYGMTTFGGDGDRMGLGAQGTR